MLVDVVVQTPDFFAAGFPLAIVQRGVVVGNEDSGDMEM